MSERAGRCSSARAGYTLLAGALLCVALLQCGATAFVRLYLGEEWVVGWAAQLVGNLGVLMTLGTLLGLGEPATAEERSRIVGAAAAAA